MYVQVRINQVKVTPVTEPLPVFYTVPSLSRLTLTAQVDNMTYICYLPYICHVYYKSTFLYIHTAYDSNSKYVGHENTKH